MTIGLMMGYMYKAPFYARASLFLSSVPISIVMNSIRIAMVAILVNQSGVKAAEGFMHYFEGWVIFLICIGLLLFEAKLLNSVVGMKKRNLADSFDYLETQHPIVDKHTKSNINRLPIIIGITVVLMAAISTLSIKHRNEVIPIIIGKRLIFDLVCLSPIGC